MADGWRDEIGTGAGGAEWSRPARAQVTIRDVARASSVSVGTVSKALNNSGSLRQETRDKVIAIAKELEREAGRRLIDLIAGEEFRGARRIPCTLVARESGGTGSRAAGNTTGGI